MDALPQTPPPKPNSGRTPIQAALQALAEVCATPFPGEEHLPLLRALDLKQPEDVAQLGNIFMSLRLEAAIHVVRAVRAADLAAGLLGRGLQPEAWLPRDEVSERISRDVEQFIREWNAAPGGRTAAGAAGCEARHAGPDPGGHACHVAIVASEAMAPAARALYPQRVVVVAGGPVWCGWLSALLLERLTAEDDLRWLRLAREACCSRFGGGQEVAAFAPTDPGPGQDAGAVVIVWGREDLDAVTAALGCAKWVTLWGGAIRQTLQGPVVMVGEASSPLHFQWLREAVVPWLAPGVEISVMPRPPHRG